MATIDVKNLDGKKVGDDRPRRRRLRRRGQRAPPLGGGQGAAREAPRRHRTRPSAAAKCAAAARSRTSRRAPAARARARPRAPHFVGGGKVVRAQAARLRVPRAARRSMAGALRAALSLRAKEQKIVVVDSFDARRAQDQARRHGARRRSAAAQALIVDAKTTRSSRKSARNLPQRQVSRARRAQRLRRARPRDAGPDARDAATRSTARLKGCRARKKVQHERAAHHIIKRPLLTEKGTRLKETGGAPAGTFTEDESSSRRSSSRSHRDANKIEIKHAVEALFKVKVADVHTLIVRGKDKRVGRFMRPAARTGRRRS